MPPSTRSTRVVAPADRIYESPSPLAQAHFPPRRQRVYGRTSLGAPLIRKRQGTLTQIGFVNPENIDAEIEEFEREERERGKRRKEDTPKTRLRAKPVISARGQASVSGVRLGGVMDNREEDGSAAMDQEQGMDDMPVQRIDDTPEPSVSGERPKKRRKSKHGIKIGVKIVTIKVESPEVQRHATQHVQRLDQQETQGEQDIDMVMDSFQAAPSFEEERDYAHHLQVEARQGDAAEKRRNRVIPDSDAESEDEEIVYDSNDEQHNSKSAGAHHEDIEEREDTVERADSDIDLDAVKDSAEGEADSEQDLDDLPQALEDDVANIETYHKLYLTREIADSQAESEDDANMELDAVQESQQSINDVATLVANSFSGPSVRVGSIRVVFGGGPIVIPDSFSVPGSPTDGPQPAVVADSFYHAHAPSEKSPQIPSPLPEPEPETEAEVDFVPSSSTVSVPEVADVVVDPIPDVQDDIAAMPPPKTPTKPRRTEVPNTNSTCSPLSTQSTMRSITPSSARSKIYNRSPLKRLSENVHPLSLSLPRLSQSPTKRKSQPPLRESQISTQGTPTQRSRISQLSSFIKPEPRAEGEDVEAEDEPTIIPESPNSLRVRTPRNDSQFTADTNSPSRQIHSEISAALGSDQHLQPPSSGRTIRFVKTEIQDSQADSDDEEEEEVLVPSSPKPTTPRVVRFRSIPRSSPHAPLSSPARGNLSSPGRSQSSSHSSSKPSLLNADTQMQTQYLGDSLSASYLDGGTMDGGTIGESQWFGDLLPESLMMIQEGSMSVPPMIADDDSVWDEFGSRKSSIQD